MLTLLSQPHFAEFNRQIAANSFEPGIVQRLSCRRVREEELRGTGYSCVEPSGQRTWRAVMGEALVATRVEESCDQ